MPISGGGGIITIMAAAASTLKNGLISWYQLDEASGTRADSHTNALDMTVNSGAPGQVTGRNGTNFAVSFASGDALRHVDAAAYDFSSGCSVACWVRYPTAIPTGFRYISTKYESTPFEFRLVFDGGGTNKAQFQVKDSGGTEYTVRTDTFGANFVADTWYFIVGTCDNSNIKISVNAGTQDSSAAATMNTAGTDAHLLGDPFFGAAGYLDQCGLWGRALTASEITQLYAGGNGLEYSQL